MACPATTQTPCPTTRGFIYETLCKIDQMQKAACVQTACEGCEGSLISAFYNTKPIVIYLRGGVRYAIDIPETETQATVFRIENIKNDCVILRLLTTNATTGDLECTNYTVILTIECICSLQCLAPICCDPCTKNCGAN